MRSSNGSRPWWSRSCSLGVAACGSDNNSIDLDS